MGKVTLTPELRSHLNGLDEHLELCDETGRTIGHFLTDDEFRDLVYAQFRNLPSDEADRQRAREELARDGGMTTAEAVAYIAEIEDRLRGSP